ncbi:ribosome maturation factor RimM [Jeotgalibacillus sp. R-1-5s-1]|uniref:ribosome maturation factor RimM n=1 Tax=Jeotgalibacillus sp. R-1-5s-1 TaxID=2555897 RepID=UPI00106BE5D6|nr:ribosome maturation factor RimM [Jeotgalibacillus sp. R-1-5s-1]TFE03520.1 ribosome maturation factor RimM [Jeotgalibacillus sp. R-1-5s-1]
MMEWFDVGKIVNTHGIKGEVRVISSTDFPEERYAKGSTLFLFTKQNSDPRELTVKHHRKHKNFDLLTFEGLDNVNEVEPFKEGVLRITDEQLTDLDDHEYYYHEIIGCEVVTDAGESIGTIKEILSPGANDVWVVQTAVKKEVMIPFIADVVLSVDPENKKVVIHPMEGLLE